MPRVSFTSNLQRHVVCPVADTSGADVRSALDEVFTANPQLRSYVLDDQGQLRRHVCVYVNAGDRSARAGLDDALRPGDEVFVFQALSGG